MGRDPTWRCVIERRDCRNLGNSERFCNVRNDFKTKYVTNLRCFCLPKLYHVTSLEPFPEQVAHALCIVRAILRRGCAELFLKPLSLAWEDGMLGRAVFWLCIRFPTLIETWWRNYRKAKYLILSYHQQAACVRLVCFRIVLCWDAAGAADQSVTKKTPNTFCLGLGQNFQQWLQWHQTHFCHFVFCVCMKCGFSALTINKVKNMGQLWKALILLYILQCQMLSWFIFYIEITEHIQLITMRIWFHL